MDDEVNRVWAGYAAAIAELANISPQNEFQRFHIAPQAFQCLVSPSETSQFYANYMIFKFADSIPRDSHPLLEIDGHISDAYQNYLSQVDLESLVNDSGLAATQTAQKSLADIRILESNAKNAAKEQYLQDCPLDEDSASPNFGKRVDQWTGEPMALFEYIRKYHAEVATYQQAVAAAITQLNQIVAINSTGNLRIMQYQEFLSAMAKAKDESQLFLGYNMQEMVATPYELSQMANGAVAASSNPNNITFDPNISLGGEFGHDLDSWIQTFPPDYPDKKDTFYANARFKLNTSAKSMIDTTWEHFGFSKSAQMSRSYGWIFWSYTNSQTNTVETHDLYIKGSEFTSGLNVTAWGIGIYPVIYGEWFRDVLSIFPKLNNDAWTRTPNIANDISQKYTSVVVGYGVEIKFTLQEDAWTRLENARKESVSKGGSFSIFGCVFGSGGGNSTVNSYDTNTLVTNQQDKSVTLLASKNKVPVILAAMASKVEHVPEPPPTGAANIRKTGPFKSKKTVAL